MPKSSLLPTSDVDAHDDPSIYRAKIRMLRYAGVFLNSFKL
jgi:hypothetical protein